MPDRVIGALFQLRHVDRGGKTDRRGLSEIRIRPVQKDPQQDLHLVHVRDAAVDHRPVHGDVRGILLIHFKGVVPDGDDLCPVADRDHRLLRQDVAVSLAVQLDGAGPQVHAADIVIEHPTLPHISAGPLPGGCNSSGLRSRYGPADGYPAVLRPCGSSL